MIGSIFPRANAKTLGLMKGILRERGQDTYESKDSYVFLYSWIVSWLLVYRSAGPSGLTSSYCVNLNSYSGLNLYKLVINIPIIHEEFICYMI